MAARTCPVCAHPKRAQIEASVAAGQDPLVVAQSIGVTTRQIAKHADCGTKKKRGAARGGSASSSADGPPLPIASSDAAPLRAAAPVCKVCSSSERAAIDAAISSGEVPSAVARRFFLAPEDVRAHAAERIPEGSEEPAREPEDPGPELPATASAIQSARAQLARVRARRMRLQRAGAELHEISQAEKDEATATRLLLQCEEAGEISEADILQSAAWRRLSHTIASALKAHPAAARELGKALQALTETAVAA